jgi:hypothetical protein
MVTPFEQRSEWLREWRAELWHVPAEGAVGFALGSFRDALWLRRNRSCSVPRDRLHPESPWACLALLALLAPAGFATALWLASMLRHRAAYWNWGALDVMAACLFTLAVSCALLLRVASHAGLRRVAFLLVQAALIQPWMVSAALLGILAAPAGPLAAASAWVVLLRWVYADQRKRCPVCLHLLSGEVRVGDSSRTFLDWHGAESLCARGHGRLEESESPSSYRDRTRWLRFDESWQGLFPR